MSSISIIIPVLNEENTIEQSLAKLKINANIEVIIVDGGSDDKTIELAKKFDVKVLITNQKSRAYQMNCGAAVASSTILLFLHIDAYLPPQYQDYIRDILANPSIVLGAFELGINSHQFSLRLIEVLVNWRSQFFSLPYGDQAFFIRAATFQEVGGFLNIPIMEDFEFIQRLKSRGKIVIAPAKVLTSPRRWQKLGVWQTTLINQLIILGYNLGVSPEILAKWYGKKP